MSLFDVRPSDALLLIILAMNTTNARFATNVGDQHDTDLKSDLRYLVDTEDLVVAIRLCHEEQCLNWEQLIGQALTLTACQPRVLYSSLAEIFSLGLPIKRPVLQLSSTECERVHRPGSRYAGSNLLGIAGLMSKPIPICADNNGIIAIASNPEFHANTKHIGVRYHTLQEEVAAGCSEFIKIPTTRIAAGVLMKANPALGRSIGSNNQ